MSHFAAIVKPPRPLGRLCRPLWAAGVSLAITALTPQAFAACQYVVNDQWGGGFTATIKVTNSGTAPVSGWNINWRYNGADRITSSWNVIMSGSNPYTASNVGWNGNLQPNQTVEFGVQGSKGSAPAELAVISGSICGASSSAPSTSSSAAPMSSSSSTPVVSSSSSSQPNPSGCGNNSLFCLDFENVTPGTDPAGFFKVGTGIDVVQGQEAHSGTRSVKVTSSNFGFSGYFKRPNVPGKHWGRLYYKMKTPVPNINTWLHATFVAAGHTNAEHRLVDTVQEASGAHQYLYNVEPGDVSLQGAYAYRFDSSWVCTEWFIDNQTNTYRFFRNGEELFFTHNGVQTNSTNLNGFPAITPVFDWFAFGLTTYQQSSGVEGWLDDLAVSRERIGCDTTNNSNSSVNSLAPSSSSRSSSSVTPSSSSVAVTSSSAPSSSVAPSSSSRSSSSLANTGAWTLSAEASYLNFVTTKNTHVIEAHSFGEISGAISDAGIATLTINLSSVNTGIALRDQRMRDLLFEVVSFPNATVTLAVPNGLLTNLAVGSTSEIDVTATLNLHGISQPLATRLSVQKLTATRVLVQNLTPILVSAADYDLSNGVEALREAVAIASISKAVPVDFTLVYDAR